MTEKHCFFCFFLFWKKEWDTHASKVDNVFLHPLHDLSLVEESVVGGNVVSVRQETVKTNTVVEIDHNDIVSGGIDEACAILIRSTVLIEASALYEEEDWQF